MLLPSGVSAFGGFQELTCERHWAADRTEMFVNFKVAWDLHVHKGECEIAHKCICPRLERSGICTYKLQPSIFRLWEWSLTSSPQKRNSPNSWSMLSTKPTTHWVLQNMLLHLWWTHSSVPSLDSLVARMLPCQQCLRKWQSGLRHIGRCFRNKHAHVHARTHIHAHTHTHAHTHPKHTHKHTHTQLIQPYIYTHTHTHQRYDDSFNAEGECLLGTGVAEKWKRRDWGGDEGSWS